MIPLLLAMQLSAPPVLQVYVCKGNTPQGEYVHLLKIEKKDDNYFLEWSNDDKTASKGLGMRTDNTLSVVFMTAQGNVGVASYRITKDGLEGGWAGGDGKVYVEKCGFHVI